MNKLNLGIRAHDVDTESIDSLVKKIQKYDVGHVQLAPMKSFPNDIPSIYSMTAGTARYYRNELENIDIDISVLGSYVNLSSNDLEIRKDAVSKFKHCISLARDFDCSVVASETGSVTKGYTVENYTEEAYQATLESVKELAQHAEQHGITIAIEAGINHPIHTAKLLRRLLDDVNSPNLKIILDVANLMNPDNYKNQENIINEAFELYGDDLFAVHLKDFIYDGDWIKFVPFGTGELRAEQIIAYLKHHKPGIYCLLEGTQEPHIDNAIQFVQNLYEKV